MPSYINKIYVRFSLYLRKLEDGGKLRCTGLKQTINHCIVSIPQTFYEGDIFRKITKSTLEK